MAEVYQRYDLFKKLESINPKFDAEATLRVGFSHFGIKDKDGSYTHCGGFGSFCKTWCDKYGDHIDYTTKGSFQSGKLFYMTWKNLDTIKVETSEDQPVTTPNECTDSSDSISESTDTELPEIDWGWVDGLKNNKYAKSELEDYAKPYGIDLKKNMTIDNMRKAFREHLGIAE